LGKSYTVIPPAEGKRYGPGESVTSVLPGDFLLTHANAWTSKLIRFGEGLRYWGERSKFAHWSHAALFVSENGDIVEALGSGVQKRNVSVYRETEYHVIRLTATSKEDRDHAVAFAGHCLNDHYGFLTIISLAITLLTASKFFFGVNGQMICSGLVARALERFGAIFQYDSWHTMPADLAECFSVVPVAGASKGTIPKTNEAVIARSK
jgi:hypothetical protein